MAAAEVQVVAALPAASKESLRKQLAEAEQEVLFAKERLQLITRQQQELTQMCNNELMVLLEAQAKAAVLRMAANLS